MSEYLKVEGADGLVRDVSSGAIINTNRSEFERYMNARNRAISQQEEVARHSEEINNIKSDLSEIKQMLLNLLAKD